jgi:hypothetical protein
VGDIISRTEISKKSSHRQAATLGTSGFQGVLGRIWSEGEKNEAMSVCERLARALDSALNYFYQV